MRGTEKAQPYNAVRAALLPVDGGGRDPSHILQYSTLSPGLRGRSLSQSESAILAGVRVGVNEI